MRWFFHKVLPYLVMAGVIGAVVLWRDHDISSLSQHGKYSVAVTTHHWHTAAGDKMVAYEFDVLGVRRYGDSSFHLDFALGKRYFVRFDSTDASNSELLSSPAVPDTLISVPSEGWARLPVAK